MNDARIDIIECFLYIKQQEAQEENHLDMCVIKSGSWCVFLLCLINLLSMANESERRH